MEVIFKILRQQENSLPRLESYTLDVEAGTTILECLNQIKWEKDGTLAFRKNCRNTICGSCAMKINGRSALACKENVGSEVARFSSPSSQGLPEISIAPLGNMPVIKDLVVDMTSFWDNLEAVEPYVSTRGRTIPEREFLQTPEERSRLDASGNCILCGACYSECNAREVNENFLGPHSLAKAQRMLKDSRDTETEKRIEIYGEGIKGVWGCTRCYLCNEVCPMEVNPMTRISEIKQEILANSTKEDGLPIRHRKVLIELVKAGGWVNERKFALQVVGNFFKDIPGVLSLLPVGLRTIAKGKFPGKFEPSEGTKEIRSLIESVQEFEKSKK